MLNEVTFTWAYPGWHVIDEDGEWVGCANAKKPCIDWVRLQSADTRKKPLYRTTDRARGYYEYVGPRQPGSRPLCYHVGYVAALVHYGFARALEEGRLRSRWRCIKGMCPRCGDYTDELIYRTNRCAPCTSMWSLAWNPHSPLRPLLVDTQVAFYKRYFPTNDNDFALK
jgi:hypothetical protein